MDDYDIAMEEYYKDMDVSEVMPAESGIEASVVTKVGGETDMEESEGSPAEDAYTGEGMDAVAEEDLYAEEGVDYEGDMGYMDGNMDYMADMEDMGDMEYMGDMGDMGDMDYMGDMGYMGYMDGMETGMETASSLMSSGLFVFGIAGISLIVGIGLGILAALLKAKKGLKPYED